MFKFLRTCLLILMGLPGLVSAGPVDINSADAQTLSAELKGIGLTKAKAIVEYRQKHGPFKNPEDLSLVKGIGEKTVALNLADIRVKPVEKR